jgi:hypothetical protein
VDLEEEETVGLEQALTELLELLILVVVEDKDLMTQLQQLAILELVDLAL